MSYQAFEAHAAEYDAWYDSPAGSSIFALEANCLRPLLHRHKRPYLEIGLGSGRFAQALGIEYGVEPALALLRIARARGIQGLQAVGERLPFPDGVFGGVLMALTLCFVSGPPQVLREAWRVLRPGGGLVLGLMLRGSPWAEYYSGKGRKGHPLYSRARFFSPHEVESLLQVCGFHGLDYRSILFQPPGQGSYHVEQPLVGYWQSAGFVAIESCKGEA